LEATKIAENSESAIHASGIRRNAGFLHSTAEKRFSRHFLAFLFFRLFSSAENGLAITQNAAFGLGWLAGRAQ